jgi:DNA repair photolyase
MLPIEASKLLIVEGVEDDARMAARAERLRAAVVTDDVRHVDDEQFAAIVQDELTDRGRHGMGADFRPVVILNRFRFDDDEAERTRRIEAFPALNQLKYNGYGGFDWRESGSPDYRARTGLVCQPAWQLHTVVGCPFRCAYCSLSWSINLMLNMEEFVERLDERLERCGRQTLLQYDNWTDTVCFEPAYGGAKLLIDYFARRPGQALELYVGKSDHVDYLLDYDHRGHTVCCWSLAAETQARLFEHRSASTAQRIEAMRKCQAAGYPVRVRLSPIIPVRGWRDENRRMIEALFRDVRPDVVTVETIRFLDFDAMAEDFDVTLLDEEFVDAMRRVRGQPHAQGCEVPDEYRKTVYRLIFDELARLSPATPVAFCREKRTLWDHFADEFARWDQTPDDYLCNCGPFSHPATVAGEIDR